MERLHAGWLVKSPPGKKTFGPWRLFKSKWRERYFVLYAPPSSQTIPGCCSAVLCYYDDDNLVKEYGRIDLSRCEEVLTQLESDTHHHIFALRIANKDSERTYYLAARSEDEMNEWANCLCCVLRLSGGEGISLASGFEHLFSNGDGLRSPTRCCSILTQKSGEQRRTSNVPVTISKSATALNIRMSESTASNFSSNSSTPPTTTQEPSGGRKGKRSSILSVVVRPAAASMRRPTGPANPVAQSKFQTFGGRTGVQSYQPNSPLALQGLIGLPVQKSSLLPATPAASYENVTRGQDFTEHDGRWRSWETAAAAAAFQNVYGFDDDLQSPPTIPDRPSRSPSSVQLKDAAASHRQHYGNLSGDWLCSKSEESDDESFDPDYVLHRPSYYIADDIITTTTNNNNNNNNNTITNNNNNEGAVNMQRRRTETSEEDRGDDDDYTYPNVHYPNCSPNGDLHGAPLPPAGADATAGEPFCEEDSYDFLPTCRIRESSDRTSVTRSSCDTPNQDSGVYDILPLCSFSSDETGPATNYRTSGFESSATLDLRGIVYQNDVFFRRPSTDSACAYPPLLPLDTIDDRTESILPPLPGKKVAVMKKEEEEAPSSREKTRMPPPSLSRTSLRPDRLSAVVPCYINNADVLKAHRRIFDAEDVYLPMNKSRTSDSVYIQMRSPDAAAADCVFGNDFTGESSCDHDRVGDLPSLAHAPGQFAGEAGNDQTQQQQSSASLVPIRFTANTRSFRRKEPGRRETLDAKLRISTSGQKENIELCVGDASSCCPPPIPLKKNESNNPNYVHYATLNLDSALDSYPSPLSSPTSPGSRSCFQTDTLYRQIDPEKTKALCELKKQMDDRQRYCSKFSSER